MINVTTFKKKKTQHNNWKLQKDISPNDSHIWLGKACDSYQRVDLARACDTTTEQARFYYWSQAVSKQLGNIISCRKQNVSQFTVFMMPLKAVT